MKYQIGMIGLGVMGRNLVLNLSDHGYSVAGYDLDSAAVEALENESKGTNVKGAKSFEELAENLESPKIIIMLVPAGKAVDSVINAIMPFLQSGDILIDGGNSHFKDTENRQQMLLEKGMYLLGVGISGGEFGARYGPSLMPGGNKDAYEKVQNIFESIAAKFNGEPCAAYLGPGSAGHYVKMIHNGIEYGLIQLIAESYDLMKRGLEMTNDEIHDVFARWNTGVLKSYLVEITADIFLRDDEISSKRLIDVIADRAMQKGTGVWSSEEAMDLRVPDGVIDMAVAMRDLSDLADERKLAGARFSSVEPLPTLFKVSREHFLDELQNAVYVSMIITYAQGMAILQKASAAHKFDLSMEAVARIWRGGCIIRSEFLEIARQAFSKDPQLPNLILDPQIAQEIISRQMNLRSVVCQAGVCGIPVPALMCSLAYFDAYRSKRLPANLIQALRDYFGSHTYRRIDKEGTFHTDWTILASV